MTRDMDKFRRTLKIVMKPFKLTKELRLHNPLGAECHRGFGIAYCSAFEKCKQIWCFFFFVKCPSTGKAYTL
jgi:hypothetical protein